MGETRARMGFVWADNSIDAIVVDEWLLESKFDGSVRVDNDQVRLSAIDDGVLRQSHLKRTANLRRDLFDCLDALDRDV